MLNGHAVFDYSSGNPIPYVKLPHSPVSTATIITIETWVNFDPSNSLNATLFSFGPNVLLQCDLSLTIGDVYLVIEFNAISALRTIYANGLKYSTVYFNPNWVTTLSAYQDQAYIGRNTRGTGPGLIASIDEFRIWSGHLSEAVIYSHYLTGVDESHIQLSSFITHTDLYVTFLATTVQSVNVAFYGGASGMFMFGSETTFVAEPIDKTCGYRSFFTLNGDYSSLTQTIPAMNYSVTLLNTHVPAPSFADCGPIEQCYCARNLDPYSYLDNLQKLSQDIIITSAENSVYPLIFTYHSGVCYQAIGSESFSNVAGPCVDSSATVLNTGDSLKLHILLFERYPEGSQWISQSKISDPFIDYNVSNGQIVVFDLVSGKSSSQTFEYNNTQVITPPSQVPHPVGTNYFIVAGDPLPSSPYTLSLTIFAERKDSSSIYSVTMSSWYIPVIGSIAAEVPNFFPVASNPGMVFLVLRDPPGGDSYTEFKANSEISFDLTVDHTDVFVATANSKEEIILGAGIETGQVAGVAVAASTTLVKDKEENKITSKNGIKITSTRASTKHFVVSMSFSYDIQTSKNPRIAGHLSDVIVGGGIDLIVSDGIKGIKIYVVK